MINNLPKVSYKGILELGEMKISCAVLDNGERILVDRSLSSALGIKGSGSYWKRKKEKGAELPEYISVNYLSPYISEKQKEKLLNTVLYYDKDNEIIEGISASLLIEICDIWQKADKSGALENRLNAKKAAENAYIIFKGFAQVGITALIDEATGYQYDREKDELQKILKAYISEELLPWQKTFPDTFYKELFRLNGWDFTINGIKKRPSVIGTWTKKLIYEQLPQGVLNELENTTPKSIAGNKTARLHQSLTPDIGNPSLMALIYKTIALFQLSENMQEMWHQFEKMKGRERGQQELPFKFDKNGYTIETSKNIQKKKITNAEAPTKNNKKQNTLF